jgi:hypothetical protein
MQAALGQHNEDTGDGTLYVVFLLAAGSHPQLIDTGQATSLMVTEMVQLPNISS